MLNNKRSCKLNSNHSSNLELFLCTTIRSRRVRSGLTVPAHLFSPFSRRWCFSGSTVHHMGVCKHTSSTSCRLRRCRRTSRVWTRPHMACHLGHWTVFNSTLGHRDLEMRPDIRLQHRTTLELTSNLRATFNSQLRHRLRCLLSIRSAETCREHRILSKGASSFCQCRWRIQQSRG